MKNTKVSTSYTSLVNSYVSSADNSLLHRAYLDWEEEPENIRKTGIIATLGPKTSTVEGIQKLRKAGMNIARLNFSHGDHSYHASVIENIRASFKTMPGPPIAIALDTKGPEIRTGSMAAESGVSFVTGDKLTFTVDTAWEKKGSKEKIFIDYKRLPQVMSPGKFIYIDDGTLSFKVVSVGADFVQVEAQNSGTLLSKKGVNLPKTDIDLPAISERDKSDLQFAVKHGVDFVFASFVRCEQDISTIRSILGKEGEHIHVIAKIENHQGMDNFSGILKACDGVMVARGDLGTEIPAWKVFIAQKSIISRCNIAGKPVICATQMMQSMVACPRPTRAEASDVANAVLDGADCVMLSAETASGQYPVEAISIMSRICQEAENVLAPNKFFNDLRIITPKPLRDTSETVAVAAVNASLEEEAKLIIVLTTTGKTARLISKYRPRAPIIAVTRNSNISRQCQIYRGVYPIYYETTQPYPSPSTPSFPQSPISPNGRDLEVWQGDVDKRMVFAMDEAKKMGMLHAGDVVVAVQGWASGAGKTNCLRIINA